jgi:hypothetical protein
MNTLAALRDAMAKQPDLTIDGLAGPTRNAFAERRAELEKGVDQFERAVTWLTLVPPRQSPNRRHGHSYEVKHAAQRWAGGYISNGALIAAALHLNLPIHQCPSGINAWLAISSRRSWP